MECFWHIWFSSTVNLPHISVVAPDNFSAQVKSFSIQGLAPSVLSVFATHSLVPSLPTIVNAEQPSAGTVVAVEHIESADGVTSSHKFCPSFFWQIVPVPFNGKPAQTVSAS